MNKLQLFNDKLITKDELLIIYIISEAKTIDLSKLLALEINNAKLLIDSLYQKAYIDIDFNNNLIMLNLEKKVNVKQQEVLNVQSLDEVRVLLNREIKNYELELLQQWIKQYSIKQIKESVYKAMLKNIDNFKYIEKILQNSENEINSSQNKAENYSRKFDFFN
ncbi:MAG: DnaD domain protein [Mycoplasmatales bacterium]